MTDQLTLSIHTNTATTTAGNYNVASIVGLALALTLNMTTVPAAASRLGTGTSLSAQNFTARPNLSINSHQRKKRKSGINKGSLCVVADNTSDNQISRISLTSDHMDTLLKKVESFTNLNDGWDGHEGDAPDQETVNNAITFLSSIPNTYINNLSQYRLAPTSYGTIVMEWKAFNSDFVYVEIGYDQIAYFWEIDGEKSDSDENILINSDKYYNGVVAALSKLYSPVLA